MAIINKLLLKDFSVNSSYSGNKAVIKIGGFMPILFLLGWALYLIIHFNAEAMTIEQYKDYNDKLDISVKEEIHEYVCSYLDCYAPLHVDEFKTEGTKIAALHVTLKYEF